MRLRHAFGVCAVAALFAFAHTASPAYAAPACEPDKLAAKYPKLAGNGQNAFPPRHG